MISYRLSSPGNKKGKLGLFQSFCGGFTDTITFMIYSKMDLGQANNASDL